MTIPLAKSSEQALIGMALKGNREVVAAMAENLTPEHFFSEGSQEIVSIILALESQRLPVDFTSVEDEAIRLKKGHLTTWMLDASEKVQSWDEVPIQHHISRIEQAATARLLIAQCQDTLARFEQSSDYSEIFSQHVSRMGRLEAQQPQETTFTARQVGEQLKAQIKASQVNPAGMVGMPTGFEKLDLHTGGFRPGELIVVAARPGVGKSVFATQILLASPYDPSGLVTLEMSASEIFARMTAFRSGTSLNQIRQGRFHSTYDENVVTSAIDNLQGSAIYFEDCSTITISALRAKIRRLHSKCGIKIAVLDYLQLVSATPGNRAREIGEISRGLKALAKELHIPIVALAQLNRAAAEGEEPGLHHLRDSGEIEQDADIVILLHRPPPSEDQKRNHIFPTLIKIAKQRNGPCVAFMATLYGSTSKFTS